MSLVWHFFRTDLRVVRALLLPLGFLYLAQLGVLLGLIGSPAPELPEENYMMVMVTSFVWMLTLMIGLPVLTTIASFNNPSWRDTFGATRPLPLRSLVTAKLMALFLVLVLPHVLTELILLIHVGSAVGEVWLGVLQKFLSMSVIVFLITALAWFWRSKKETIRAYIFGFLVVIVTMALGALFVVYFWERGGTNAGQMKFETSFTSLRIFVGMAVVGALFWILLLVQWKQWWSFGKRLTAGSLIIALTIASIWFGPRRSVEAVEVEAPLLVGASMHGPQDFNGVDRYSVRLRPGAESLENDFDVKWSAQSPVVDGRKLHFPSPANPLHHPDRWVNWAGGDFAMTSGVRDVLGSDALLLSESLAGRGKSEAQLSVPSSFVSGDEPEVSLRLFRHRFEWNRIAELPLSKGAKDGGWKLEDRVGNPNRPGWFTLSLSQRMKNLWIAGAGGGMNQRSLRFMLMDDESGVCIVAGHPRTGRKIGGWTSAPWQGHLVEFDLQDIDRELVDPERCHLLIFKPKLKDSTYFDWNRRLKILPVGTNRGLARDPKNADQDELIRWLEEHPAPSSEAGEFEVAKQVVAILEQTNRLPRRLDKDHPVIDRLAGFTSKHLDLLLRALDELAVDNHYSKEILQEAVSREISRAQLTANLRRLGRLSKVMTTVMKRGWLDPLAETMVDLVRKGDHVMFHYTVTLPDRGGLSDEECLMIFRMAPTRWKFEKLREVEGMRAQLDDEVNQWFEKTLRQATRHGVQVDTPLEIALYAGHDDAPEALHHLLVLAGKTGGYQEAGGYLKSCFEPSDFSSDPSSLTGDFIATDPGAFEFDEESRLYRLKKP